MRLQYLSPRHSILSVVGLLLWVNCAVPIDPQDGKDPDYFPLEIGHTWSYAPFDPSGRQLNEPVTYRIMSVSRSGNVVIYFRGLSQGALQDAYYKDETGVYTVGDTGELLERRIAYPVSLDKEWDFAAPRIVRDASGQEIAAYRRRAKVVARENITLFKGLKFENTLKVLYITEGPSRSSELTRWYAPEVGWIRETRAFTTIVTELTEYSLVPQKGQK